VLCRGWRASNRPCLVDLLVLLRCIAGTPLLLLSFLYWHVLHVGLQLVGHWPGISPQTQRRWQRQRCRQPWLTMGYNNLRRVMQLHRGTLLELRSSVAGWLAVHAK
jgi:hypothetical protein